MINLRHLETFLWVARLSGFHAAARKLNTTQPAVSARIALLERELGTRLLDRRSRGVILTPKGVEILELAERMLSIRADIMRICGSSTSFHGVLRLGVTETIVHTWLADLVERTNTAFPSVTLDIEVDSTPNLRNALLSENLDLAIIMGPVPDAQLRSVPVCSYPLGWFVCDDFPIPASGLTLADLAEQPIITFRRGSPPYVALKHLLMELKLPNARLFGSSSIAAILRMARDGIGPCVLPHVIFEQEPGPHGLKRIPIQHDLQPIDFCVSYAPRPDSYLAMAVTELAVNAARQYEFSTDHSKIKLEQHSYD